jgi:hypothetical protein
VLLGESLPSVSEDCTALIFRVKQSNPLGLFPDCLILNTKILQSFKRLGNNKCYVTSRKAVICSNTAIRTSEGCSTGHMNKGLDCLLPIKHDNCGCKTNSRHRSMKGIFCGCIVLCTQKPSNRPIPHLSRPTKCI